MGSRLAARMAGIMPLTRPVTARIRWRWRETTEAGRDDEADVGGLGVLGDGAVEGDAADHDRDQVGEAMPPTPPTPVMARASARN
jgi:hypothetical protein